MVMCFLFLVNCQRTETKKNISNLKSSNEKKRLEAIYMLENIKDTKSIDPIIDLALNDVSETVRVNAVEALGKIGASKAILPLKDILTNNSAYKNGILDTNYKVKISDNEKLERLRCSAAEALGLIGDSTINKSLILVALFDNSNPVSASAITALMKIGNKSIVESSKDSIIVDRLFAILEELHYPLPLSCLNEAFSDNRLYLKLSAVKYCSLFKNPEILNVLVNLLNEHDFNLKIAVIETLGEFREQEAVPHLIETYTAENLHIKMAVINALVKIRGSKSIDFLFKVIQNNNQTEKDLAFDALGRIGDPSVNQKLLGFYDSGSWEIRNYTIKALGKYINNEIISNKITNALRDPNVTVRKSAADMLLKTGKYDELMTVFDSKNIIVIAYLYSFYITQNLTGKEDLLIQALNIYGDVQMANAFLNSINFKLSQAAYDWANINGYTIELK